MSNLLPKNERLVVGLAAAAMALTPLFVPAQAFQPTFVAPPAAEAAPAAVVNLLLVEQGMPFPVDCTRIVRY